MAHLKQYFELQGLSTNQVFVWIDIFCVNLHRDTPTGSADLVLTNELIASSRKVLLFLDSEGVAFSRTWVLYEAWQASLSERHDKLVVVPTSWAWQDLVFPYIAMDIASSHAWQDVDRLLMLREFQKAVETSSVAKIKEAMLLGTKRELQRTDVTVTGGQPLRMVYTGTAYGLLLFLKGRYTEAEEVLSGLQHKMEKFGGLNNGDDTEMLFHLALIAREKGSRNKSEAYLLACIRDSRSEGVREDLYLEAMLMYAQCLYDNEQYTKGELLCRKLLEMTDQYSDMLTEKARLKFRARGRVQLSALSLGQKLVKEVEERAEETLRDVRHNKEASTELLAASCYKILSE
ncbi:hypothetical protein CEUSTIGMA_g13354.t1 [Chlamydomonas eustigma]|uniref:Uncharacterized protein n=1 Tax=Chlamydomonas eustigma TaxID=1157962 RepID=A0A250XS97_9CHLO|nr:hypothetical protein CEUSTIGMA_g13354.t1 [Chlamydomonas eustigma]|eukprot:GAX85938.1 hypothetical protein CEUSTIGMA_g13354.t1 [Chlamydomonas eustigma]